MNFDEFLELVQEECDDEQKNTMTVLFSTLAIHQFLNNNDKNIEVTMPKLNFQKDILETLGMQIEEKENGVLITAPKEMFQSKDSSVKVAVKK